jgi:hypothetical protein
MRSNSKIGEKKAKVFYTSLWKLLIDARYIHRILFCGRCSNFLNIFAKK